VTSPITFTAHGVPQPGGSKRSFPFSRHDGSLGVRVSDDNPAVAGWKRTVAECALAKVGGGFEPLDGPLAVTFAFYLPRPRGHYGKKGLRPSAPSWPTVKPDVLKLARAAEDALTGILWTDDARIVDERLRKHYCDDWREARVDVTVRPVYERPSLDVCFPPAAAVSHAGGSEAPRT